MAVQFIYSYSVCLDWNVNAWHTNGLGHTPAKPHYFRNGFNNCVLGYGYKCFITYFLINV